MNRLQKLEQQLERLGFDCLLVSDPYSIEYLTGKWISPGERMLVLKVSAKGKHQLFLNRLFNVPEELGFEKVWYFDTDPYTALLANSLKDSTCVGVDKMMPARFLLPVMEQCPQTVFKLGSFVVDEMRMIKDETEIALMKEASRINDLAMDDMAHSFVEGITENEMATQLLSFYKRYGAHAFSFSPIVGYGPNGADGHHGCDDTPLKEGDSIVVDMGCVYQGFCSDMTRTFFYKKVSDEQRKVYNLVLKANETAEAMIKPGVRLCDIDRAARQVIEEAGYGPYFNHRLGHFIGREVHEYGDVSSGFDMEVQPGMIFSIEPGIYLEGKFGVRIEDLVLVTDTGCIRLNNYPKDLKVIE